MVAAGKKEIREWFVKGVERGKKYMLVVYDLMDAPDEMDSPYYADSDADAVDTYCAVSSDEFCSVMEVYDLTADMEEQLAEKRAWRLPGLPDDDDDFGEGFMDSTGIKDVIQMYFDASFESSGEKMAQVFHDPAHIYGHGDNGALADMDKAFFVKLVGSPRPGPKLEYPRQDEVLSIDFTGEDTAVARVKLRVGNTLFTDMLCFMRLDNKWGVISKVFSGVQVGL